MRTIIENEETKSMDEDIVNKEYQEQRKKKKHLQEWRKQKKWMKIL